MESYDILVIILSVALAIFLVLGIVLLVFVINIVRKIKAIINKAEAVVENVETVASFFKKSSVPVAIATLIGNISDKMSGKDKKSKK
jgi:competence protein ComGC